MESEETAIGGQQVTFIRDEAADAVSIRAVYAGDSYRTGLGIPAGSRVTPVGAARFFRKERIELATRTYEEDAANGVPSVSISERCVAIAATSARLLRRGIKQRKEGTP